MFFPTPQVTDDLDVQPDFNVTRFVEEARQHNLSKASPTVWHSTTYQGPVAPWQSISTTPQHTHFARRACAALGGHCGVRLVDWVETYMVLYTREAWLCQWSMFDDAVLHDHMGAVGYGYDRCFQLHCGAQHHKQGTLLDFVITHNPGDTGSTVANDQPKDLLAGLGGATVGRRLMTAKEGYKRAQLQAYRLEKVLREAHGGGRCMSRERACARHVCDIEQADGTVIHPRARQKGTRWDAYPTCWHSCCCYDVREARAVPREDWTLPNAAMKAALRSPAAPIARMVERRQSTQNAATRREVGSRRER